MSLKQIFEGWRNHLHPPQYLKEKIEEVHQERMLICRACPMNSINRGPDYHTMRKDEHCTECGCPLISKTKCLTCSCPLDKWPAEITEEQEKIINDEKNI